jgi:hypothetical protein
MTLGSLCETEDGLRQADAVRSLTEIWIFGDGLTGFSVDPRLFSSKSKTVLPSVRPIFRY